MNECFIIDITHYLDEKGLVPKNLSTEAKQFVENLGNIIASVTKQARKSPTTHVQCWGDLNHAPCHGEIDAGIEFETFDILWFCQKCQDQGSISNWQETFWDLGYRP